MATKAELEAELAVLREKLKEHGGSSAQTPELPDNIDEEGEPGGWDNELSELLAQIEELPSKHPLLLALGIFALGYMIGRSK